MDTEAMGREGIMTRFKQELMNRGFRLEETEICMPTDDGYQAIVVNSEKAQIEYHHTGSTVVYGFKRNMDLLILDQQF